MARSHHRGLRGSQNGLKSRRRVSTLVTCLSTPGARLFGAIRIGSNVKIGANAVVYRDVPENAVVALDPGFKILSYRGNRRA
jgi:serine acetyltransferase